MAAILRGNCIVYGCLAFKMAAITMAKVNNARSVLPFTVPLCVRFILQDLDDLHLFVEADVARQLQEKLDELMEKNSYNPLESEQQKSRNRD